MVEVITHAITAADLGVVVTSDSAMVRVDIPQGPGRSRSLTLVKQPMAQAGGIAGWGPVPDAYRSTPKSSGSHARPSLKAPGWPRRHGGAPRYDVVRGRLDRRPRMA